MDNNRKLYSTTTGTTSTTTRLCKVLQHDAGRGRSTSCAGGSTFRFQRIIMIMMILMAFMTDLQFVHGKKLTKAKNNIKKTTKASNNKVSKASMKMPKSTKAPKGGKRPKGAKAAKGEEGGAATKQPKASKASKAAGASAVTSSSPSIHLTHVPSNSPSFSNSPSVHPTNVPSNSPSRSMVPSKIPSNAPSEVPSNAPSTSPSSSMVPSKVPSMVPSQVPSSAPSLNPTVSAAPSSNPSFLFRIQAESVDATSGTFIGASDGYLTDFDSGESVTYNDIDFGTSGTIKSICFQYAKSNATLGIINVEIGGTNVLTFTPPTLGAVADRKCYNLTSDVEGIKNLVIAGSTTTSQSAIFNLDWIDLRDFPVVV